LPGGISVAISQSTACELEIKREKKNEGKREKREEKKNERQKWDEQTKVQDERKRETNAKKLKPETHC
jgi:hypothetical protein